MKKLFPFFIFFVLRSNSFAQYQHQNISLLSHWNDKSIPLTNLTQSRFSGVWGYADTSNHREYAIVGSGWGTHFIDVTNPANPVQIDSVAGRRDSCLWRELKSYKQYLYAVSDDGGDNSLQIIDMSYLPDSVHVVYDDSALFSRSHTIYVDGDKLYCGNTNKPGVHHSMAVYSLANPESPVFLAALENDYSSISAVHDMYVRHDTVYTSCGLDAFYIFKFDTTNNIFSMIGSLTGYLQQGYNHSSSLTDDGKTLIMTDESIGMAVKSIDVSDFGNITVLDTFRSAPYSKAIGHNPYVVGNNWAVVSYYGDGVQVFDISNPANVFRTGYFDTDTLVGVSNNWTPTYHGCWGAYPYLPSGILLAVDMQNGLYVLDASVAMGVEKNISSAVDDMQIFPNPFTEGFVISINTTKAEKVKYQLTDVIGRLISEENIFLLSGTNKINIRSENIKSGVYFVRVVGEGWSWARRIIKE